MASDVDVREMLSLQLSEIEMLQSMFPGKTEFELDDPSSIAHVQSFIDGGIDYDSLNNRLGFTLTLDFPGKGSLDAVCHLPHDYPQVPPEIFLRSPTLSRNVHRELSDSLQSYILDDLERGDICLGFIIQWLQDNAENFFQDIEKKATYEPQNKDLNFSRMWIYSHHIYSKIKRKAILDFSDELRLTGFCMPGKPGIICIEGDSYNVEDFWHRIRRMQWKRLVMKEKEDITLKNGETLDNLRKFEGFQEQYFEPRQGKGRGAHSDRGLLYQFLEQKGFGNMFQVYFGVEGRMGEDID